MDEGTAPAEEAGVVSETKGSKKALEPRWHQDWPSSPIPIYQGRIRVATEEVTVEEDGEVALFFTPTPQIRYVFDSANADSMRLQEGTIALPGLTDEARSVSLDQTITLDKGERSIHVEGTVLAPLTIHPEGTMGRVEFGLCNFPNFHGEAIHDDRGQSWLGRAVFEFGKWRVTLDALSEASKRLRAVDMTGGFLLTHSGRLERIDGKLFDGKDARKALDVLYWSFTLMSGSRCPPILPMGFRRDLEETWGALAVPKATPGFASRTWFPSHAPDEGAKVAEGIRRILTEENAADWLHLALGLYTEANRTASGIDLSLAKAQIALELLSNVVVLEKNRLVSEEGFDRLPAADRMRLALLWAGIPSVIPAHYAALTKWLPANKVPDGPTAITEVRNALIHPTKDKRRRLADMDRGAMFQAYQLSLHYVELLLLRLVSYDGAYTCRFPEDDRPRRFNVVPWGADRERGVLPGTREDYDWRITLGKMAESMSTETEP